MARVRAVDEQLLRRPLLPQRRDGLAQRGAVREASVGLHGERDCDVDRVDARASTTPTASATVVSV
ncbi:hypothetical protein N798_15880 [Knoellia flava TL1]|uniref:Uncharacterized protein n=1 Tax=Knoellia flava TL1 TaxID=1385518 RepID=A0ABR4XA08_9MICO|nr:hypothetical protein N798_15880 [Knoellia flava TL1]